MLRYCEIDRAKPAGAIILLGSPLMYLMLSGAALAQQSGDTPPTTPPATNTQHRIVCEHAAPPRGSHWVCDKPSRPCDCHLESNVPGQPIFGDGESPHPVAPSGPGKSASTIPLTKPRYTDRQERTAESEAGRLQSWRAMYRSFQHYLACDDAAVGEGYSNSVVRLLTTRWNQVQELHRLTIRNQAFETFVLKHIDPTAPKGELEKVEENARKRCPKGAESLCGSIQSAARQAEVAAR